MAERSGRYRLLGPTTLALLLVLTTGAALRLWAFPARYEMRTWTNGTTCRAACWSSRGCLRPTTIRRRGRRSGSDGPMRAGSRRYFAFPTAEERQVPAQVRPYTAINHALFDTYHDMSSLRRVYVALAMLLSLVAVAAGFGLGRRWGGLAGAVLLGGLTACVPLLVLYAASSHPYSAAWSFAVIAMYFAASGRRHAAIGGGCFLRAGDRVPDRNADDAPAVDRGALARETIAPAVRSGRGPVPVNGIPHCAAGGPMAADAPHRQFAHDCHDPVRAAAPWSHHGPPDAHGFRVE